MGVYVILMVGLTCCMRFSVRDVDFVVFGSQIRSVHVVRDFD